MPDFNGVALWNGDRARPRSGAVLYLWSKASDDAAIIVDGAEALVTAGSRCMVIRGVDADTFQSCLAVSVEVANKALDLLAIGGFLTTSLADPAIENVTWVDGPHGVSGRIWCAARSSLRAGLVTAEVRDTKGNLVSSDPEPDAKWHEGFRYFRLAQVTDDLFDAFRNSYLALEAMLSSIAAQRLKPDGRPAEREGDWFRRALGIASTHVDLYRYTVEGNPATAIDDIFDEIYVKTRTAVFHAKAGRPVLIPLDAASRPDVMNVSPDWSVSLLTCRRGSPEPALGRGECLPLVSG